MTEQQKMNTREWWLDWINGFLDDIIAPTKADGKLTEEDKVYGLAEILTNMTGVWTYDGDAALRLAKLWSIFYRALIAGQRPGLLLDDQSSEYLDFLLFATLLEKSDMYEWGPSIRSGWLTINSNEGWTNLPYLNGGGEYPKTIEQMKLGLSVVIDELQVAIEKNDL